MPKPDAQNQIPHDVRARARTRACIIPTSKSSVNFDEDCVKIQFGDAVQAIILMNPTAARVLHAELTQALMAISQRDRDAMLASHQRAEWLLRGAGQGALIDL